MPENLLAPCRIKLYGREVQDIVLTAPATPPSPPTQPPPPPPPPSPYSYGANFFLREQLQAPGARLARIYAFSYEGSYYMLPKPAIFLVHGIGEDPNVPAPAAASHVSRGPNTTHNTGLVGKNWEFSADTRMWEYDKGDFSLRFDIETGSLEQILLEATIKRENLRAEYSGRAAISHRGGKLVD